MSTSLSKLWSTCVDKLKDRVNNRSFWEALEATRAIIIEGDSLIIGLEVENFNRATYLQQTSQMHEINSTVSTVFQRPLTVRIIEGVTLADWEVSKQRDARIAAMRANVVEREVVSKQHNENWDVLSEYVSRMFAQMPNRSLPQFKARYVTDALYIVAESMDSLYPETPEDTDERSLARILDRIANAAEMPASMVAFELERLRAWRKATPEQSVETVAEPEE